MINKNFSIEITKDGGCFNNPHKFILSCSEPKEILHAITLKGFSRYQDNNWEVYINGEQIVLIKGLKKIENIDGVVEEARQLLNKILDLTDFEINVATQLLKHERK